MARIRSIKPEIRTSEKVNSWPIEVRYFWIMLWGYVDDHGKGRDNPKLIVADTYPLDDDVTAQDVDSWLGVLEQAGVLRRYEVNGKRYLSIINWLEHQRPSHPAKSVIPDPPVDSGESHEASGNPPESRVQVSENGSPEQRAESSEQGAVEQGAGAPRSPYTDEFEHVYSLYPIKVSKGEAFKAFKKAKKQISTDVIEAGVIRYRDDPNRDPQFTKHFSTWLNQGCWDDGPLPPRHNGDKLTASAKMQDTISRGYALQEQQLAIGNR